MDLTPDQPASPARHRAPLLVLGAVLAALLTLAAVLRVGLPGAQPQHAVQAAQPPPARPQVLSSTPSAPDRSVPSTPTSARTSPPPVKVRHDHVASAAPTAFSFAGKGFTIKADVCGMEFVRPLDPPGEQHHTVCWVQHDFGFAPGSRAAGTTYLLGHAWAQDRLEVLNRISETAMRQVLYLRARHRTTSVSGVATYRVSRLNGDVITLRTSRGVLRYTVRDAYAVAKLQAGDVQPLMAEHSRNRVVIITCGELDHVDYDYNIIVEAYLTSSVAADSTT